jgi:hypothetical protein
MYSNGSEARIRPGAVLPIDGDVLRIAEPNDDEGWKAKQRDWLVAKLRALRDLWLTESQKQESYFCPDPELDRAAKGRTAGCARQLNFLLEKLL